LSPLSSVAVFLMFLVLQFAIQSGDKSPHSKSFVDEKRAGLLLPWKRLEKGSAILFQP